MEKKPECVLCGDGGEDREGHTVMLISSPKGDDSPICIGCFLLWQRINRNGWELLSIVNQLDILAEDVLRDTIDPDSLRAWASQLRNLATPILADIYREDVPVPEPTPQPPEGVDALQFYVDLMERDGY